MVPTFASLPVIQPSIFHDLKEENRTYEEKLDGHQKEGTGSNSQVGFSLPSHKKINNGYGWNQREREELGEKGVDVKSQTLLQCTLYPFIVTA